jgi:hypothetical protein
MTHGGEWEALNIARIPRSSDRLRHQFASMTPVPSPCDSDRPLDVARVERTLHAQFPELAPVRAKWFGSGCSNEVYRVNGVWLFRFPKVARPTRS